MVIEDCVSLSSSGCKLQAQFLVFLESSRNFILSPVELESCLKFQVPLVWGGWGSRDPETDLCTWHIG